MLDNKANMCFEGQPLHLADCHPGAWGKSFAVSEREAWLWELRVLVFWSSTGGLGWRGRGSEQELAGGRHKFQGRAARQAASKRPSTHPPRPRAWRSSLLPGDTAHEKADVTAVPWKSGLFAERNLERKIGKAAGLIRTVQRFTDRCGREGSKHYDAYIKLQHLGGGPITTRTHEVFLHISCRVNPALHT